MPQVLPLLAALAAQSPQEVDPYVLARQGPGEALTLEARTRPDAVREAVTAAFATSVRDAEEASAHLAAARHLAQAYAAAWSDSFLLREVERFMGWPVARRAAKVAVDSIRRAGNDAWGRDGPATAIRVWRRALSLARDIGDTAATAALLGNVAAGFLEGESFDSAEVYATQARLGGVRVGDVRVQANALWVLAGVAEWRGDLRSARERHREALALRERIGDARGMAAGYNSLGLLAESLGDVAEARRQFEAALVLHRRDGREDEAATILVNLAGMASLAGDFVAADTLYRHALAGWRAAQQWANAAVALHGLGLLEARRGDYRGARDALVEALTLFERTGQWSEALAARRQLAGVLAAQGDLQGALDHLRHAEAGPDPTRAAPTVRADLALATADLAQQLNQPAHAEQRYADAQRLYAAAGDLPGQAQAYLGLSRLMAVRGDYDGAEEALEYALRTQQAVGDRRAAALTRLARGQLLHARGDLDAAREVFAEVEAELDRVGDVVAAAAALGERAAVEADAGLPAAAEHLYRAALERLEGRVAPDIAWRLHAGLALTLRSRGSPDAAAAELRQALGHVERSVRSLTLAERRSGFLSDKAEVYAHLALTELMRGDVPAAFEVSERLRAREMLEVLARGRVHASSDAVAGLVEREQDLRRRIAEMTRALEGAPEVREALRGPDLSVAGGVVREALLQAQDEYARLRLEILERAPRHGDLVSPAAVGWHEVARRLAPREAMVEYLLSDSGSVAFVVVHDTAVAVALGIGRRELARLIEFMRGTLEPSTATRTDSLWRGALMRLHDHLVAPIAETGLLSDVARLVIVPHAELHYLPFAALLDRRDHGRYLVERYEVLLAPSASVWASLGERPAARPAAGALALAPTPARLRASRGEAAIAAGVAGPGGIALNGSAASEAAFRREAPSRRLLHLATYGVLNKQNPLFSFVELAPGDGHDGRLEVHEVFDLDLAAELVVLSACQTGLASGATADVPAGDDWVGLTRAFLHAGASRVLATLWPVEDEATADFMRRFYDAYAVGTDPAHALARAQRATVRSGASAHPFHWAGFVAVGGRSP